MKRSLALFVFIFCFAFSYGQKVIFLHHSTGGNLFYEGNVRQWISNYNINNGTQYQVTEKLYPNTPYPWSNYPYDYWNLWINSQCNNANPNIECIDKLVQNYDVIIFKHCYPGASIVTDNGNPSISSQVKTLANYKLQYRALRALMDSYPNRKFIIWTMVPLHRLATNTTSADRARQFVDWVKTSWLTEDAKSHPNIYIFDFFGYASEGNATPVNGKLNCLKYDYEISHSDGNSHPNLLANQTIGPVFAEFIVNTIKNQTTSINPAISENMINVYPNPASNEVTIDLTGIDFNNASIEIFDLQGRLTHYESGVNRPEVNINTNGFDNGVYIIRAKTKLNYQQCILYILK